VVPQGNQTYEQAMWLSWVEREYGKAGSVVDLAYPGRMDANINGVKDIHPVYSKTNEYGKGRVQYPADLVNEWEAEAKAKLRSTNSSLRLFRPAEECHEMKRAYALQLEKKRAQYIAQGVARRAAQTAAPALRDPEVLRPPGPEDSLGESSAPVPQDPNARNAAFQARAFNTLARSGAAPLPPPRTAMQTPALRPPIPVPRIPVPVSAPVNTNSNSNGGGGGNAEMSSLPPEDDDNEGEEESMSSVNVPPQLPLINQFFNNNRNKRSAPTVAASAPSVTSATEVAQSAKRPKRVSIQEPVDEEDDDGDE
jgi:hypothetical protein